ncbi:hypothetical protein KA017_01230 [Candidatus Woesebacteria bacterium]|nr:hypothetical protein [Candidatus Woesebacteria bacterium]
MQKTSEMVKTPFNEKEIERTAGLTVFFNNKKFVLPWKVVSDTAAEKVVLPFFDPNENKQMANAAAVDLSKLLLETAPSIVITPPSSKSLPMIRKAIQLANRSISHKIELVVLSGGYDIATAQGRRGKNHITEYSPITAHGRKKYLGIEKAQLQSIQKAIAAEQGIAFIDDVVSTGATLDAMKKLLLTFGGVDASEAPTIAAVLERTYINGKPLDVYPNVSAVMENPAIVQIKK